MKAEAIDGRLFVPEHVCGLRRDGAMLEVLAPAVGFWLDAPVVGSLVIPGGVVGELEVLGVRHRLRAPEGAAGIVLQGEGPRLAARAVQWGDVLMRLDPEASPATVALGGAAKGEASDEAGQVFRSPISGRYYARARPGAPRFVSVGDVIQTGQTVALLEVMKTFNRVTYGGAGLPERVRVLAIGPEDEADVDEGDVLLRVEPG